MIVRTVALLASLLLLAQTLPADALSLQRFDRVSSPAPHPSIVFAERLKNGTQITVYSDGFAIVRNGARIINRYVTPRLARELANPDVAAAAQTQVLQMLRSPLHLRPYVANRVLVVLAPGVSAGDTVAIGRTQLLALRKRGKALTIGEAPAYTTSSALNFVLARLGADRIERVFKKYPRSQLELLASRAVARAQAMPPIDLASLYRVHITGSSVEQAVRALAKLPGIAYTEPDWRVTTLLAQTQPIPEAAIREAEKRAVALRLHQPVRMTAVGAPGSGLPSNFGIESSMEGQMTAPAVGAIAAYDEIERKFHQLPGTGVTVANISIGLLTGTDESAINQQGNDPCQQYYAGYGPTTRLIGSQRYIDWPGMPLIPTYVADAYGDLSGSALACGAAYDPTLGEIGLDFSMMAPLPHDQQRSGASANNMLDLLGIAPGANYRLVVPETVDDVGNSDIMGAFLAAATQTPAPDVITASLGFGTDSAGFPGRYLEDDVLTESLISTIVNGLNIVVCIAANDGLRTSTNAAVNPSGGSTPTEIATSKAQRTSIWDVGSSTAPSYDPDSGAIDVGGTTLDDISAANPIAPASGALKNVRTFAETRWTGMAGFSSGMGSRVNISAPSDNLLAMYRCWRPDEVGAPWPFCNADVANYNTIEEGLEGGTSAAAPEVAAAAAVAIQVARLTGHPFAKAADVRAFLVSTATPVAPVPQADVSLDVGPQLDLRRAVESLMAKAGESVEPGVARIDVMHRQSGLLTLESGTLDASFLSDTDPAEIDLGAPYNANGVATNDGAYSPITIAPAWENIPDGVRYRLYAGTNSSRVLSTSAYARLYPAQILAAAGDTLAGTGTRNVSLTYEAYRGLQKLVRVTFVLGFGPMSGTQSFMAQAPIVAPVSSGATVKISYDLTNVSTSVLDNPKLVVTFPARPNPESSGIYQSYGGFIPLGSAPLSAIKGTVDVPVSELQGSGIYGIGILLDTNGPSGVPYYSDFAYTRIPAPKTNARPVAPLLGAPGDTAFGHALEIPYNGAFTVKYDVSNVPGATGAMLDVSAPGPTLYSFNEQTFNNPNGTGIDDNGKDSGSVAHIALPGRSGTVTISASKAKLRATLQHAVRVIATANGQPIGEDGDESTILEDGIVASDGGNIAYGFGANESGDDGMYTSVQVAADGSVLSSAASFAQSSGQTLTIIPNTQVDPPSFFAVPGFGLFPKLDTAFFTGYPLSGSAPLYYQATNISTVANPYAQTIVMPSLSAAQYIAEGGTNHTDLVNAMAVLAAPASGSGSSPSGFTASSPSGSGTFSSFSQNMALSYGSQPVPPLLSVPSNAYQFMNAPAMTAFDYDSSAKIGYMMIDDTQPPDCTNAADMPVLAAFNYSTTGVTAQTITGTHDGTVDFAVDPATHIGALSTTCTNVNLKSYDAVTFINLTNGSIVGTAPVEGPAPAYPGMLAVDIVHHLVLAQIPLPDDLYYNENALSQVYVMNEQGKVLKKLSGFGSYASILPKNHFFTLNPATRTGFMMGPAELDNGYQVYDAFEQIIVPQITPFSY